MICGLRIFEDSDRLRKMLHGLGTERWNCMESITPLPGPTRSTPPAGPCCVPLFLKSLKITERVSERSSVGSAPTGLP